MSDDDSKLDPRTVEAARAGRQRCAWVRAWVKNQISNWLTNAPSTWVLIDPSEWHELGSINTTVALTGIYMRLGFSIHTHEVHMADVVVVFWADDDDAKLRRVRVLVEAETEADARSNVEAVGDLLVSLDSPKKVDEYLYEFEGKPGAILSPEEMPSLIKSKWSEISDHNSKPCEPCLELRRRLGHDGAATFCPALRRMVDELHNLENQERNGKVN